MTITQEDIAVVQSGLGGGAAFGAALAAADSPEKLVRLLTNYVHFNATFGAGVANLAGEIGVRKGLFRDPDEPVWFLADRSMDVAADIFAAAVDEFDDRSTAHRDTHRALATATIKGVARFFDYDAGRLIETASIHGSTLVAIERVREGYVVGRKVDEAGLVRAIGFHLGSELLADGEFRLIDSQLRAQWGELQAFLERTEVLIDDQAHNAYQWIRIHTDADVDHFAHAVRAADRALGFYAGDRNLNEVKADILGGVRDFAQVQAGLMTGLNA